MRSEKFPLARQPKLLRVLQDGRFERVGEDSTRAVNVHVIAASN
jgi:transcriptional regulator with GAF, ATPase, and Fis domain